jgi:hypothetical protein
MERKDLNPNKLGQDEDWEGNNAAFRCPICHKVFIVSEMIHKGSRECPGLCGKSTAYVKGGSKSGGSAYIEWNSN